MGLEYNRTLLIESILREKLISQHVHNYLVYNFT